MSDQPTFGSIFSGVGGLDLGLERAGFRCVWQVEIDPFCRLVLTKHWPDVRRHDDVRTFPPGDAAAWQCDLVCGGFPCQPFSSAGKRRGKEDPRWLWPEFARVLRLLRPRFVVLENVPRLLVCAMGDVLGDLAGMGFDAEWAVLPASLFGAQHIRPRLFVVANAQRGGWNGLHERQQAGRVAADPGDGRPDGADRAAAPHPQAALPDSDGGGETTFGQVFQGADTLAERGGGEWLPEPDVARVADGVSHRLDRRRGIGNAVVPQVAQWIGERLLRVVRPDPDPRKDPTP